MFTPPAPTHRRRRPSQTLVVATAVAIICSVSTAWATATITGRDIRANTIESRNIRADTIQSGDIRNGTIRGVDLHPETRRWLRGDGGVEGPQGPQGETGPQGIQGPVGPQGATGPAGPLLDTLPSGRTLTGVYSAGGYAQAATYPLVPISFSLPLATAPEPVYLPPNAAPTDDCPGTPLNPSAAPGMLCVYATMALNAPAADVCSLKPVVCSGAETLGAMIEFQPAVGPFQMAGTWAVTAH
jgi:hypothetical protein